MKRKHILFIVENNSLPNDMRVWNEALAAREMGFDVSAICPSQNGGKGGHLLIEGIIIYRHRRPKESSGKLAMAFEYINAIFWESLISLKIFTTHPFQVIHGANPPDHIFLIAAIFKIFGVKFIFDHHDITPENYVAKYGEKGIVFNLLLLMEKLTFRTANLVISTNESYKRIALRRGGKNERDVFVVRNGPDMARLKEVDADPAIKAGYKYLIGYVGVIGQQEGIENLLAIAKYVTHELKRTDIKFIVIGPGPHLNKVRQLSHEMEVDKFVHFTGFVPEEEKNKILATSDVCINPEFGNDFTDKSTMIKIMEYMAFGKPIVQFYTTEGQVSAGAASLYIRENDVKEFSKALLELLEDPGRRSMMGTLGKARVLSELGWARQKQHLEEAYRSLLGTDQVIPG